MALLNVPSLVSVKIIVTKWVRMRYRDQSLTCVNSSVLVVEARLTVGEWRSVD